MCGSVRAPDSVPCIGAGTSRGRNSETRAFDAVLFRSVQKRELFHIIAQAPFRQGRDVVVSKYYYAALEGMQAVACSKPPALETCSDSV